MNFITDWNLIPFADIRGPDGDVYGPVQFSAPCGFSRLVRAHARGRLLGAAGLFFSHRSVLGFSADVRARVGRILQLVPEERFFVWDDLSVEYALHYGVTARLGGHPAWLFDEDVSSGFCAETPAIVYNVQVAFRVAVALRPMILHLPVGTAGAVEECHTDPSAHELYRWARQFGFLDAMVTSEHVTDEDRKKAVALDKAALDVHRAKAQETLDAMAPTREGGVAIANRLFGKDEPLGKPNMRTFAIGSRFDPSTHYDDHYYGVGGKGILYPKPEKGWEVYRGTSHEWDGNRTIAGMVSRLMPKGHFLLDLGCGSGDFIWRMSQRGWNTVGVDISESGKQVSKVPESIIVADVSSPSGRDSEIEKVRGTQDVVTALDFWEHVFSKNLAGLIDAVYEMLKVGGIHVACICTRGDREQDQVFSPGVKVSRENAWCLVSGHVNVRTWHYWTKKFVDRGFRLKWRLMTLFQVLREQDPGLRDCRSWGARNVVIVEK